MSKPNNEKTWKEVRTLENEDDVQIWRFSARFATSGSSTLSLSAHQLLRKAPSGLVIQGDQINIYHTSKMTTISTRKKPLVLLRKISNSTHFLIPHGNPDFILIPIVDWYRLTGPVTD